jgi:hypothetical protein
LVFCQAATDSTLFTFCSLTSSLPSLAGVHHIMM